MMKDLKIVNGRVPDFERGCFTEADVLVHDGVIEEVGAVCADTREVIDAAGQIVAPGFIDIHAHEELPSEFPFTAACSLRMGVTLAVAGNCGGESFPVEAFREKLLTEGSPCNYMMYVGQNTLREEAGATDIYAPSTPQQLDRMKRRLAALAKTVSPVGLSCGLEYAPGVTAEETVSLLGALEAPGYVTAVHFRADGKDAPASTQELADISAASGYAMQMSHIGSDAAYGYMAETLAVIDRARAAGIDMTADCYPYDAFCTTLGSAVFDEHQMAHRPYETIMLTMGPNAGKRCDKAMFEQARREMPDQHVVCFEMKMDEVCMAFRHPAVMVGSDGGYVGGLGHPRGAGTFPRVLGLLSRDMGVLPLIEALKKMTLMPAQRLGLSDRGRVSPGCVADLVLFDPQAVADRAEFDLSKCSLPPVGISCVLVAGQKAAENGVLLRSDLGRYLPYDNSAYRPML